MCEYTDCCVVDVDTQAVVHADTQTVVLCL